jgi:MiaB/RimO family radical SAM methylthiotransferase
MLINNTNVEKIFLCTTFKLCDNNGYLTTQLSNFFLENEFEIVRTPEESDAVVITTCGFDQEREDESISMVAEIISKYSGEKRIIVCGCLPKINPDLFERFPVTLIGSQELDKFNTIFKAGKDISTISGSRLDDKFISRDYGFVDAYYIQICQGCVNNCSYCAIKKTKGYVKSKKVDEILAEIEKGYSLGFKTFMLLGDDCASYGADVGGSLADLLNRINKYDIRILINYLEPGNFLRLYPEIDPAVFKKIDFMNIPIQGASKRIIALMNRRYDPDSVVGVAREIKKNNPHLYLETHVIFGFPSETDKEFSSSLNLSDYFDAVIYFCYADRKGVKSALLPEKISSDVLRKRATSIASHPRFRLDQKGAEPPLVLLGYGPETSKIIEHVRPQ